ncbi:MAG: double-strand break repair helicase AddA, partial [Alphaproteobacteria bacterium]
MNKDLSALARTNQLRAADPAVSAWVKAHAGSGKTRVLVERVIRLLLSGTRPDQILCLTFTKAAAAEMKERLYGELGRWAGMEDAALIKTISDLWPGYAAEERLYEARRLFARALETPGGLKVQTIHGFCQAVLERFPAEAGVPPSFEVIDDRTALDLKRDAIGLLIQYAQSAPAGDGLGRAFAFLVDEGGEHGFEQAIGDVIQKSAPYRAMLDGYGNDLERALSDVFEARLDDKPMAAFAGNIDMAALRQIANDMLATGQSSMEKQGKLLAEFVEDPSQIDLLRKVLLKADGDPRTARSLLTKKVGNYEGALTHLQNLQDEIVEAAAKEAAVHNLRRALALADVVRAVLGFYEQAKAARGVLDYEDLILRTRDLIAGAGGASWVHYKLDRGIDHILVDEAQDTAPAQWAVISGLADEFFVDTSTAARPRTVFSVGDEKQSIYRFQGAAPRAFADMATHFAARAKSVGMKFEQVPLGVSFRSTPQVLSFVDKVFAVPETLAGLASGDEAVEHIAFRENAPGLIEIWKALEVADEDAEAKPWDAPLDMPSNQDPKAQIANRIANVIAQWLENGEWLASEERLVEPSDILILVRSRSQLVDHLVAALKKRSVPVAGTDRMELTEQIVVKDLIALGRFALLPQDDLNLAALLKSPLFGLDDAALFDLAYDRASSLWGVLRKAAGGPLGEASSVLSDMAARADFERPFEWFSHMLNQQGGRARLCARLGTQAHDAIDAFLARALAFEQNNVPSLERFLHEVERESQTIKRDMDRAQGQVRIMTVHGAKGLESEIVFLPDLISAPSGRHDPVVLPLDGEAGQGPRPLFGWAGRQAADDPVQRAARTRHREADGEEYRRLLYVALTRAKDRLYVTGFEGKRKSESRYAWAEMIEAAKGADGVATTRELTDGTQIDIWRMGDTPKQYEGEISAQSAAPQIEAPSFLSQPLPDEPTVPRPLAPSRLDELGDEGSEPSAIAPAIAQAGGVDSRQRGTIIHRLIELLPDIPRSARKGMGARLCERLAPDVAKMERSAWVTEALNVLDDPAFAELFGEGSRAEVSIAGHVPELGEGTVLSGQIDRLAVTAEKVLIVDYKTNRMPPQTAEDVPLIYLKQMAAYRAALRPIYPGKRVLTALLWTA